mmetsp:Transcript_111446/g.174171  ORF Transcript_111446/g.174171 Transcript_111446/m.174171 type:complete len:98 (-) Transcript_111446:271-564(-)
MQLPQHRSERRKRLQKYVLSRYMSMVVQTVPHTALKKVMTMIQQRQQLVTTTLMTSLESLRRCQLMTLTSTSRSCHAIIKVKSGNVCNNLATTQLKI